MMTFRSDTLTYSSGSTLCQCDCKYYWRYERGLRPVREDDSESLFIGSGFHRGIAAWASGGIETARTEIDRIVLSVPAIGDDARKVEERGAKIMAMIRAAVARWPDPLSDMVEVVFNLPIRNPDTTGTSRSFGFSGRLDSYKDGMLIDFKTVSNPTDYVRTKQIGYQIECYALALIEDEHPVNRVQFRLVQRPTIKYCGKDADARAYEERCCEWIATQPYGTLEHELLITPERLASAKQWMWQLSQRVLLNRRSRQWLRNEFACHNWNRTCEYMELCELTAQGYVVPEYPEGYEVLENPHVELEEAVAG